MVASMVERGVADWEPGTTGAAQVAAGCSIRRQWLHVGSGCSRWRLQQNGCSRTATTGRAVRAWAGATAEEAVMG